MPKACSHKVPTDVMAAVAEYFKVLSEVSRLQILSCLRPGPMNVMELTKATGLGQANLSKHLKVLTQAGMLARQPSGVSAYYEIVDPLVFELCESVCNSISDRMVQKAKTFDQFKSFRAAIESQP
ncbi:metalloregulator ArsR/SmtB family transcription factor [Synechococcales cyanobacterium C]|uniref:Metalloregulator ArsR/SmtB family transcription factor n=1 Tax=Petrachloros mirabilis ULC683 TaxID=2781853 RepID=A0A8K1ZXR7_9CYAN|nr:metalloregulator ArsR/SmtB family transcription factor [Petrachloros mirabilis]NCJ05951.1 metalloregulator ArsR/SmtB family transcription factor [Petrachloros mirabilis ULC683]